MFFKRRWYLMLGILAVLATVGLAPLTSDRHRVFFDQRLMAGKEAYLRRLAAATAGASTPWTEGEPPNVVFILADDLGLTDIATYDHPDMPELSGGLAVPTPHLDALAEDGVIFRRAYATAAICAPSRAALLTGRHQNRSGFQLQPQGRYAANRIEYLVFRHLLDTGNMTPIFSTDFPGRDQIALQGLAPTEISLADAFGAAGYRTAAVGKWHMGVTEGFLPADRGFDSHFGFYEAFSLYAPEDDPQVVGLRLGEFTDTHQWNNGRVGPSRIHRNGVVVEEERYLTDAFAEEAVAVIEESASRDEPFFLYLALSAPHVPLQAPRDLYDRFAHIDHEATRIYSAMVASLDLAVGRVMQALEDAGVARNTVVVFTSDNGGYEGSTATRNGPLKAGKFSNFDGGLRVPAILRFPAAVDAPVRVESPVSLMDFAVTALAAAGLPLPEDRIMDGVNLLPYLAGGEAVVTEAIHDSLFWESAQNGALLAGGLKLILDSQSGDRLLYDLEVDPGEERDLSDTRREAVDEMEELWREWSRTNPPAGWPPIMNYRYEIDGRVFLYGI